MPLAPYILFSYGCSIISHDSQRVAPRASLSVLSSFWAFFLHLIQLENSLPQTHPLTYSFLPQSRTFSGFPYVFQLATRFSSHTVWNLEIISSLLFFSLPPIPSELLRSTLNSCPVTKLQHFLCIPSDVTCECFLITLDQLSTLDRLSVTNPEIIY